LSKYCDTNVIKGKALVYHKDDNSDKVYDLDILSAHGEKESRVNTPDRTHRYKDEESQEEIPLTETFKKLINFQMIDKTEKEDPIQENFF
jgi:hypothetical protein